MEKTLPAIPAKRYFTIGEVADLCGVKPHVLRYWEQEFTQLRPMKRRGNRRYYQHHEVLMIRRIRDLLYDQGFTISGARNKMQELLQEERKRSSEIDGVEVLELSGDDCDDSDFDDAVAASQPDLVPAPGPAAVPRREAPAAAKSALLAAATAPVQHISVVPHADLRAAPAGALPLMRLHQELLEIRALLTLGS
jgi:DNA-binding transcriptional MerR regulator